MPKIFTDEEKEGHRAILLDQGLGLIMKNGCKNVTIDQLVQLIGASKGYFYVLFPSKEQFFLQAIASQMERHFDALREVMERHPSPKEIGEAYRLLLKICILPPSRTFSTCSKRSAMRNGSIFVILKRSFLPVSLPCWGATLKSAIPGC